MNDFQTCLANPFSQRRRDLLRYIAGLGAASLLAPYTWSQSSAQAAPNELVDRSQAPADLTRDEVEKLIRPLFSSSDPEMWQLATDAYQHCILGKLRPAEPPLLHDWLVPGGVYVGQWIWDTTFVADLLSILPNQRDTLRGIFQNYWDFQARWTATKPSDTRGFIANFIAPDSGPPGFTGKDWLTFPAYSQAPLIAWGMERVYKRNGDLELLRNGIGPLEEFHDWYWRERDLHSLGLICVGSYSEDVQHARYETYDNEVDLDGLQMTTHPIRKGANEGKWYGDICIPANTAYLLMSEASLARMAETCGNDAMAERRRKHLVKGIAAMRKYMWNEARGCFLAVNRDSLKQIPTATVGGFVPLMAGIPTVHQAQRMAQALTGPDWATPLPIPTVARGSKNYVSDGFWRGDVWPAPNYQVATGLSRYGHTSLAAHIVDLTIDNAIKVGISEHYDSQTGRALGVPFLGMSAVILTMALDGLGAKRRMTTTARPLDNVGPPPKV